MAGALNEHGAHCQDCTYVLYQIISLSDNIQEIICRSNSGRVTKIPGFVLHSQVPQVIAIEKWLHLQRCFRTWLTATLTEGFGLRDVLSICLSRSDFICSAENNMLIWHF